jgi:hypothetical protein
MRLLQLALALLFHVAVAMDDDDDDLPRLEEIMFQVRVARPQAAPRPAEPAPPRARAQERQLKALNPEPSGTLSQFLADFSGEELRVLLLGDLQQTQRAASRYAGQLPKVSICLCCHPPPRPTHPRPPHVLTAPPTACRAPRCRPSGSASAGRTSAPARPSPSPAASLPSTSSSTGKWLSTRDCQVAQVAHVTRVTSCETRDAC